MKIIIVGGGISSLSTYLFLHRDLSNLSLQIKIYESHQPQATLTPSTLPTLSSSTFGSLSSSTAIVGGGIGLSPNGMRILKELSPELHDKVVAAGCPCANFIFKSSRGWKLSTTPTGDGRVGEGGGEEVCVSIGREAFWRCLFDAIPEGLVEFKKVVSVEQGTDGKRPKVKFENGEVEEADLIIGADGVRSVTKKAIFEEEESHYDSSLKPEYEGLIGVGGFVPTPPSTNDEKNAMTFTFGPNGFFGYAPSSPTTTMWWSTCESPNPPLETRISIPEMQSQLRARHGSWKDPLIHSIIEKSDVQHIYPVWTTPWLPYWGKGGVVLVGDAAHALQPTSGQGSSQAMEDAKTLSLCLGRYITKDVGSSVGGEDGEGLPEALENSFKLYYTVRNPRIKRIVERTKILSGRKGDVGLAGEMITCFFIWLTGRFPAVGKMIIGDVNRELYHWNVEEEIEKVLKKESKREATADERLE